MTPTPSREQPAKPLRSYDEIAELMDAHGGVLARRDHPEHLHALQWLVRSGRLVAVLPGVYARPDDADRIETRLRAAGLWHPDGIFLGAAAARLSFLPEEKVTTIVMATRSKRRAPKGITLVRWDMPDDVVVEHAGVRLASPALVALDLCLRDDGAAIDEVLRRGLATLDQLWQALHATRFRLGNPIRREMLLDSRDKPWSQAERVAHRTLRRGGLAGWISNLAVNLSGARALIDIAYEEFKVAIEIDGFEFHGHHAASQESRVTFERDRWKGSELTSRDWLVLRFTWRHLTEQPEWVTRMVRTTLQLRGWKPRQAHRRSRGVPAVRGAA